MPEKSITTLLFALTLAILYGSTSWFFSKEELSGRPYWILTLGCLGIVSFLVGTIEALNGLAVVLVVGGTGIFLYSPRYRKVYPYISILLVSMLVIPYTPTITLSQFFAGGGFSAQKLFWILSYTLLLAGVIKHALAKDKNPDLGEPWVQLIHTFALYFIALSPWVIVAMSFPGLDAIGKWWLSLVVLVVTLILTTIHLLISKKIWYPLTEFSRFSSIGNRILNVLDGLFKFTWLSRLFASLGYIFEKFAHLLIRVQEGDGGILWSFLFLVLLLSLLLTRQVP